VKRTKRERPVWWPAFVLAAVGVLALLVVPQARSDDTPAAPSGVQPAPVDKPALRQLIEEETRRREQAPRADKAALRAARDAKAAACAGRPGPVQPGRVGHPIEARRGTGRRGPASVRHATGGVRGDIHDRRGRPPLRLAAAPADRTPLTLVSDHVSKPFLQMTYQGPMP
jgi:hypothetical protein